MRSGLGVVPDALAFGVVLAGRGGVDEVDIRAVFEDERDRVGVHEAEEVAGLWVDADAGAGVALASTARAAEQVQQAWPVAGRSPMEVADIHRSVGWQVDKGGLGSLPR